MTLPVVVLPDAIAACRAGLLARTEITALVGQRVGTRSPGDVSTPWLRITRIGGVPVHYQRLDAASLQVDCFAPDTDAVSGDITAHTLARTAHAVLHAMQGQTVAGAVITGIADQIGLHYQPDDTRDPPIPRWLFGVSMFIRPNP